MAIVYRHRRLDTNEIFYIGIGVSLKRPFEKSNRNKWWKNIVNKTDYLVEILTDKISYEDAKELEEFLISQYGRRDLGTGTLVNLTDGGEGTKGVVVSKEKKENQRIKMLGDKNHFFSKKHSDKSKEQISITKQGHIPPNRKLVINLETGIYYDSAREAAETINCRKETLVSRLNGGLKNNTPFRYV